MKRTLLVLLVALAVVAAGCGDDDDGGASSSGDDDGGTEEVAAGDFCEVWPALDDMQTGAVPSEGDLDDARAMLAEARASAPEEIADEVDSMLDVIEKTIDAVAGGEELDGEEMFGEVFTVALTAGPVIEEYLTENCPGYEPDSTDATGGFDDDEVGLLGIPDAEVDLILDTAFPDETQSSTTSIGATYTYEVYVDATAEAALAGCTDASEQLAAHPDASGTLELIVKDADGADLVVNEEIAPGDAGECVPAA